ncbi:MAG: HPF/RaiA family ribosome-associated protein [Gemmatirosa sp.]|nr:HPF/RaiA family ribosome-associated protein [Gemmatirosa sp.]
MTIVFHTHHADVTDAVRARADQAVQKLAARLRGATDASVRFVEDGTVRRVEIVLRAARRRPLVAEGSGARFELAIAEAADRMAAHVAHVRAERARRQRHVDVRNGAATAAATTDAVETGDTDELDDLLLETDVSDDVSDGAAAPTAPR